MMPEPAVIPFEDETASQSQGIAPTFPTREIESASTADDPYAGLKKWQRDVIAGRLHIIRTIKQLQQYTNQSLNGCIKAVLHDISNGGTPQIKRAAACANNRKGENRTLTAQTIYRWYNLYETEGKIGLAPAAKETVGADHIPLWFPEFLDIYRSPSKPSIANALREMGTDAPPYHQVFRMLKKYSNLDILQGQMSGSELRAQRAYTKRDFTGLFPMDIIVADGHSFKGYVSHPVHGKRFLPEVETIICVASRACVGWSAGLAESAQIVADAIRHAVTINDKKPMGGLPAILYTDNGAGNRAKMNSDVVTGIVHRIGCEMKFGIAGNPQGRGVIERLNASLWIPAAKKLVTYNGKDMDALAQRKRLKIVDKDLKESGRSQHLISWMQFLDFIAVEVENYNNRPHSSLPKIVDASGRRRHMTPAERWKVFVADGWQFDTLNPEEMRDLFRPQVEVTTFRGLVKAPGGNEYFNSELEHHNGEKVLVNYDIHDPSIVWVRDRQQRLICEAKWNGNRRAFFPMPFVEHARNQRRDRRLALKQEQIREIEAEAAGVIEGEARIAEECISETNIVGAIHELPLHENAETPTSHDVGYDHIPDITKMVRPLFDNEIERYEWHLRNGFKEDHDVDFKLSFEASDNYRMLYLS